MLQHRELLMLVGMTIRVLGMSSKYPAHNDNFIEDGLMGLARIRIGLLQRLRGQLR